MMRINLLPVEEVRNKLELFDQLRIGLFVLVAVIAAIAFMSVTIKGKINASSAELNKLQAELNRLNQKGVEKKDREFKKFKKELETKIDVIWDLKSQQAGPVHLLDGMSKNLPQRVWLTSVRETPQGVVIKGYAFSNVDVAQFMTNLEKSDYFSNVELVKSGLSSVADQKVMVFDMNMQYNPPKGWIGGEGKK